MTMPKNKLMKNNPFRTIICNLLSQEEKEKAKAQKEEVVTQMTEVLESELQCSICSELFIEVKNKNKKPDVKGHESI